MSSFYIVIVVLCCVVVVVPKSTSANYRIVALHSIVYLDGPNDIAKKTRET
jgi:hypothetical protein